MIKEKEILKGMTREQALACLARQNYAEKYAWFAFDGKAYEYAYELGLKSSLDSNGLYTHWVDAINEYYDEREKPKWVEPQTLHHEYIANTAVREEFWSTPLMKEISRTNARRIVEAFIKSNGGSGDKIRWEIYYDLEDNEFHAESLRDDRKYPGLITCATEALANEVISRRPEALKKLLEGLNE